MEKNEKSPKNMKEDMVTFSVKMPLYMVDALEFMAMDDPERYKSRGDVIREAVLGFIYDDENTTAALGIEPDDESAARVRKALKDEGYSDEAIALVESMARVQHVIAEIVVDECLDNGKSRKPLLEKYAKVREKWLDT